MTTPAPALPAANTPTALSRAGLLRWCAAMAWRDSRRQRSRLVLYMASIVLGVASLVAIQSFGANVGAAIRAQSLQLLGADVEVSTNRTLSPKIAAVLAAAGGEQASERRLVTMAYFPAQGGSRLVQLRALTGDWPFYGALATVPADAARTFRTQRAALVDESTMIQFGAKVGDQVRLGELTVTIAGALQKVPGDMGFRGLFAPPVYLPQALLAETELIKFGSRVNDSYYFRFHDSAQQAALEAQLQPLEAAEHVRLQTVKTQQASLGKVVSNLYHYLGLVGFMALLLGGLGVGSAVQVYIQGKTATVAILRCLGATTRQVFAVYLLQTAVLGLGGALAGAALGVGVQHLLPGLFGGLLPVQLDVQLYWPALVLGVGLGLGVTLAFALLPLLALRRISPLLALRADIEPPALNWRDPARLTVYGLIVGGIVAFALAQTDTVPHGLGAAGGLLGALLLLWLLARLLMWAVRRWFPRRWPYVWRQGLNNLYRPHNQTVVLVLCLGLGTFLLMTVFLVQHSLLAQLARSDEGGRSNLVVFDVQKGETTAIAALLTAQGTPPLEVVPMVTMRLTAIKGRPVAEIQDEKKKKDPTGRQQRWLYEHEYRSTYRDHLTTSEQLTAGTWIPHATRGADPIPVSLEADIADELGVKIGDTLGLDVQAMPVTARVTSLRKVDWMRLQTNFFMVFPTGVIDDAPQTLALLAHAQDAAQSARVQQAVVQAHPGVSLIDLRQLLSSVDEMFRKVAVALRFMALFSLLTGILVLIGSVTTSRDHLIKESVLLRTLGASRRQVQAIMLIEYLLLGSLSAVAGLLLSTAAAWALAHWVFDATLSVPWVPMALAWAAVTGLTVAVGAWHNRGVLRAPPLEVLRAEAG